MEDGGSDGGGDGLVGDLDGRLGVHERFIGRVGWRSIVLVGCSLVEGVYSNKGFCDG